MQLDSWFDVILQEMVEANTDVTEMLKEVETLLEPEMIAEQAA